MDFSSVSAQLGCDYNDDPITYPMNKLNDSYIILLFSILTFTKQNYEVDLPAGLSLSFFRREFLSFFPRPCPFTQMVHCRSFYCRMPPTVGCPAVFRAVTTLNQSFYHSPLSVLTYKTSPPKRDSPPFPMICKAICCPTLMTCKSTGAPQPSDKG